VVEPLPHADGLQRGDGPLAAPLARDAGVAQRQLDVGQRARARDEVEGLEDEPDLAVAQVGLLVGWSRQPSMFINVDLPEPDEPMIATNSPVSIRRLTPSSAWTARSSVTS
jgi:hypothetical protein